MMTKVILTNPPLHENEGMARDRFENEFLRLGVVEFKFTKADGSERSAIGTLHPTQLPKDQSTPEQKEKSKLKRTNNPDLVTYWDLGADSFRSFKISALIGEPVLAVLLDMEVSDASEEAV